MEGSMRGRWSIGVVVAIAVAISVALASGHRAATPQHAASPVQVTLALQADGLAIRVAAGSVSVTFEM
jgi:hypothetical protein